jgi:hypothetical protein
MKKRSYHIGQNFFFLEKPSFAFTHTLFKSYDVDFPLSYNDLPESEKKEVLAKFQSKLNEVSRNLYGKRLCFSLLNVNFETFTSKIYICNAWSNRFYVKCKSISSRDDIPDIFRINGENTLNLPI